MSIIDAILKVRNEKSAAQKAADDAAKAKAEARQKLLDKAAGVSQELLTETQHTLNQQQRLEKKQEVLLAEKEVQAELKKMIAANKQIIEDLGSIGALPAQLEEGRKEIAKERNDLDYVMSQLGL